LNSILPEAWYVKVVRSTFNANYRSKVFVTDFGPYHQGKGKLTANLLELNKVVIKKFVKC